MYIGWTTYLKQRFQPKRSDITLGVALSPDTATFTALRRKADEFYVISEVSVLYSQWKSQFAKWVSKQKLSGAVCHVALAQQWYQLLQIDRPDVQEQEVADSLVWPVKELIGFDSPMALDYFDLPVPLAGRKKVNVVAIPETAVEDIVGGCLDAGVRLDSISIEELAHCALLPVSDEAVVTLTQEAGEEIVLNIIKDGHLYISRRLKGFENLAAFSADELRMGVLDTLCVQIQRSMDFFESQLRQAPVRKVVVCVNTPSPGLIVEQIADSIAASVSTLTVDAVANHSTESAANLSSLGMALLPYRAQQLEVVQGAGDEE